MIEKFLLKIMLVLISGHLLMANGAVTSDDLKRAIANLSIASLAEDTRRSVQTLERAGVEAFPFLLEAMKDPSVAATQLQHPKPITDPRTGQVVGRTPTSVGDVAFELIQMKIEGKWLISFRKFYILNRSNVGDWLENRKGKSLVDMQKEAALGALAKAEIANKANPSDEAAANAIKFIKDRIKALSVQRQL